MATIQGEINIAEAELRAVESSIIEMNKRMDFLKEKVWTPKVRREINRLSRLLIKSRAVRRQLRKSLVALEGKLEDERR